MGFNGYNYGFFMNGWMGVYIYIYDMYQISISNILWFIIIIIISSSFYHAHLQNWGFPQWRAQS